MTDPTVLVLLCVAVVALTVLAGVLGATVPLLWWLMLRGWGRADALAERVRLLEEGQGKLDAAAAGLLEWQETVIKVQGRVG